MSELGIDTEAQTFESNRPSLRLVSNIILANEVEIDYFDSLTGNAQIPFGD